MRKVFWRASVIGFIYLNASLGAMIAASAAGAGTIVALVVGLAWVLGAAFAPELGRRAGIHFTPGLALACRRLAVALVVPLIMVSTGTRQLVRLNRGTIVTGISVAKAHEFPAAAGFEFNDGRGRIEFVGKAVNTTHRRPETWHVVPLVDDSWMPDVPVAAWALHLDGIQPELPLGRFHGAMVWDRSAESHRYGTLAIQDAESRHGLRSAPNAVILEMSESVADLKAAYTAFLVLAISASNLAWLTAVLLSVAAVPARPIERASVTGGRARRRSEMAAC